MENLTIQQKAERYDKALEKARQLCVYPTTKPFISDLQDLFPELKESEGEDEKIRKDIKQHFLYLDDSFPDKAKWLAWLEKQGEPTEINPSEFDLRLNKLLKQFESMPKEELASSFSFYLNVVQNNGTYKEEKQGEQKPTEFDDTNAKRMFIKALERVEEQNNKGYKLTDCDKNSWWEDFKEYTTSEQILANSAKTCKDEQKPAEWSEEDEEIIHCLEYTVKHFYEDKDTINRCCNWLKSLRPCPRWKPSDEQINALAENIEYVSVGCTQPILKGLLEDLKKLWEK